MLCTNYVQITPIFASKMISGNWIDAALLTREYLKKEIKSGLLLSDDLAFLETSVVSAIAKDVAFTSTKTSQNFADTDV